MVNYRTSTNRNSDHNFSHYYEAQDLVKGM